MKYVTVAASKTDQWLGGMAGDRLDRLTCVVATAATAAVSVKDGSGAAISVFPNSPGGGVGTYNIEFGAVSKSGPWRVTTGAGVSVIAAGDFTPKLQNASYLSLAGAAGDYLSSPDSASNSVTGDLRIEAKIAATDWTPATIGRAILAKRSAVGQYAYQFSIAVTTGLLNFSWTADGSTVISKSSTVAPTVTDGAALWVAVTHDVDNGAVGNDVKFYTSTNGTDWTQLGDTVTTAATTSHQDSTAGLEIGTTLAGTDLTFAGKIYHVKLYSTLDTTTLVAQFDPTNSLPTDTTAAGPTTLETWTLNGNAAFVATE